MKTWFRCFAVLILIAARSADAKIWTYRLKVVDESRYDLAAGEGLTLARLNELTTVRELKVERDDADSSAPTLANSAFRICRQECSGAEALPPAVPSRIEGSVAEFIYATDSSEFRQANLFYHLNQMWNYFEKLGYQKRFSGPVLVRADRRVRQLLFKHEMNNNAYFDPQDNSLNFVPSQNIAFLNGSGEMKFLDSANDPVVMAHELGHLVLNDLVGMVDFPEFAGMHEGIADYFAFNRYQTDSMGIIFGAGKPIRRGHGTASYRIGLEAHDRGLVYVQTLMDLRDEWSAANIRSSMDSALLRSFGCLKEALFRTLPLGLSCLLKSAASDGAIDAGTRTRLISKADAHGLSVKRFEESPPDLPPTLTKDAEIVWKLEANVGGNGGEPSTTWTKIEGARLNDAVGWFIVSGRANDQTPFSQPTFVQVDMQTAQVYRSWSENRQEITYANRGNSKSAVDNALSIERQLESQRGAYQQLASSGEGAYLSTEDVQLKIGDVTLPASVSKVNAFLLNPLLRLAGLNFQIQRIEFAKAKSDAPILQAFPIVQQFFDVSIGGDASPSYRLIFRTDVTLVRIGNR